MFKTRSLLFILVLALCFTAVSCSAFAADGSNETADASEGTPGLSYKLSSDGESYMCTGIGNATTTDIVIPATYKGKPVTLIDNGAFYNCVTMTSLTIQEGVKAIQPYAFRGCVRLESVTIPDSVFYVGNRAFEFCSSLTSLTIVDVQDVEEGTEGDAENETEGTDLKLIEESAFKNCTKLTSVTMPASTLLVSRRTFDGCTSLAEVTLPAGVEALAEGCFGGCMALKTIYFGGTVEQWENIAKGGLWAADAEDVSVICSDGTVTVN